MRGPARPALEALGDAENLDRCREALRVDLLGRRREQEVGARRCGQLAVAGLVAGVAVEVAALVELRRVHEQRDDDEIAVRARALDQREMPVVQRAHRRHEPDPQAAAAGRQRAARAARRRCAPPSSVGGGRLLKGHRLGPVPGGYRREHAVRKCSLRSIPGIAGDGLDPMIQTGSRDASASRPHVCDHGHRAVVILILVISVVIVAVVSIGLGRWLQRKGTADRTPSRARRGPFGRGGTGRSGSCARRTRTAPARSSRATASSLYGLSGASRAASSLSLASSSSLICDCASASTSRALSTSSSST